MKHADRLPEEASKIQSFVHYNERQPGVLLRLFIGHGGIAIVQRATGLAASTIRRWMF